MKWKVPVTIVIIMIVIVMPTRASLLSQDLEQKVNFNLLFFFFYKITILTMSLFSVTAYHIAAAATAAVVMVMAVLWRSHRLHPLEDSSVAHCKITHKHTDACMHMRTHNTVSSPGIVWSIFIRGGSVGIPPACDC